MSRRLVSRVSGSSESSSRVRYLAERRARRNSSRVVPPSTSPSSSPSRRVPSPPVPLWQSSLSARFTSRLRPLVAAQQSTGTHEPADRVHTGNQIVLAPFRVESELWFVWVFSPSDPVLPHHSGAHREGFKICDLRFRLLRSRPYQTREASSAQPRSRASPRGHRSLRS